MTAPLIFLIHCIKKVEKLTVENFDFPHLILFGLTFKEPALENSYYLKKGSGLVVCFDIDRPPLGALGALGAKKLGKNH